MAERTVSLAIDITDDADLPRVMEVLARHAAGLILEGIDARIYSWQDDEESEL